MYNLVFGNGLEEIVNILKPNILQNIYPCKKHNVKLLKKRQPLYISTGFH